MDVDYSGIHNRYEMLIDSFDIQKIKWIHDHEYTVFKGDDSSMYEYWITITDILLEDFKGSFDHRHDGRSYTNEESEKLNQIVTNDNDLVKHKVERSIDLLVDNEPGADVYSIIFHEQLSLDKPSKVSEMFKLFYYAAESNYDIIKHEELLYNHGDTRNVILFKKRS